MAKPAKPPRGQRDNNLTSLLSGAGPTPLLSPMRWQAPFGLEIEDFRQWHPELEPAPRLLTGIPASLALREPRSNPDRYSGLRRFPSQTRAITAFKPGPEKVMMCVRRKQRREVIFAKRKSRKGSQSKRRYNYRSFMKC